jgi:hypothetical protein
VRLPAVATHPKPHEELGTASQGWEDDLMSDGFMFHIVKTTIMWIIWKNDIGINWQLQTPSAHGYRPSIYV